MAYGRFDSLLQYRRMTTAYIYDKFKVGDTVTVKSTYPDRAYRDRSGHVTYVDGTYVEVTFVDGGRPVAIEEAYLRGR